MPATGKRAMTVGKFFEELEVGSKFTCPVRRTVTETDIVNFIGLSGMIEPLLQDLVYIQERTMFKERVAPGPLTFAISMGLVVQSGMFTETAVAMLGVDELRLTKPVRVGDTLSAEAMVREKRETRDPTRGIVHFDVRVLDQNSDVVMQYVLIHMLWRRPRQPT